MALVTLEMAKSYLRVDGDYDDAVITLLLESSKSLAVNVARLSEEQWDLIDSDKIRGQDYSEKRLQSVRDNMKIAILYGLGYLYEHREEADHHALTLTMRSLLFAIREEVI